MKQQAVLFAAILCLVSVDVSKGCGQGPCDAGQYFNTTTKICTVCEAGWYMNLDQHQCLSCRRCYQPEEGSHEEIVAACNTTHDTVTKCVQGFFKDGDKCKLNPERTTKTTTDNQQIIIPVVETQTKETKVRELTGNSDSMDNPSRQAEEAESNTERYDSAWLCLIPIFIPIVLILLSALKIVTILGIFRSIWNRGVRLLLRFMNGG